MEGFNDVVLDSYEINISLIHSLLIQSNGIYNAYFDKYMTFNGICWKYINIWTSVLFQKKYDKVAFNVKLQLIISDLWYWFF